MPLAPRLAALALILLCGGCATVPAGRPPVVFLTDFGRLDDAVAICKGVMLQIAPGVEIVDLTHDVPPFSILDGARYLAQTAPYYPAGTIFVAVVDPGVGSQRRALVVQSRRGQYFVLPDNGLITLVAQRDGVQGARELSNPAWLRSGPGSSTFHGRDVFAPAAAHLARGEDWRRAGPPAEHLVHLELQPVRRTGEGLSGDVLATDGPFGNLITSIPADLFHQLGYPMGAALTVTIDGRPVPVTLARTFSDVPEGAPLLYINSRDTVGLAINLGSFSEVYGVSPPAPIRIPAP